MKIVHGVHKAHTPTADLAHNIAMIVNTHHVHVHVGLGEVGSINHGLSTRSTGALRDQSLMLIHPFRNCVRSLGISHL